MLLSTAAIIAAAIGLVGTVAGAVTNVVQNNVNREDNQEFTAEENEKSREFSAAEALKSREFEEYMSSSAMQRQVADYKAAGINVGAIGGNGATSGATGTGATAPMISSSNALAGIDMRDNSLSSMFNSIMTNATRMTIHQNSKNFANNVERQVRSNAFAAYEKPKGLPDPEQEMLSYPSGEPYIQW